MSTWHAPPDVLARYATAPRALDDPTASSVEAHLLSCSACRRAVAAAAEPAALTISWVAIADRIDQPARTLAERVLGWLISDHVARVVAATPALRASWLVGVTAVVAAVVAVAHQSGTSAPFLALAPLVPLAGIAASFGPAPDPAAETAAATPLYGAGLLLRRATAVLTSSMAVLAVGSVALPGLAPRDAGWILPALALTFAALALSTWVAPFSATTIAAVGWLVGVEGIAIAGHAGSALADSALFGPAGQLAFAAIAVLGVIVFLFRHGQLSTVVTR